MSSSAAARWRDGAALLAGFSLSFAFAPFNQFVLAVAAPAMLFLLWRADSPARAAWRGQLFGAGYFGVGVSWVYVSMHEFGNMPLPLAALATALFVLILSLYIALLGYVQARLFRRQAFSWHALLALPALWTLCEWWRGWFLSGFPWLALGYSQTDTPLAGFSPVVGVYGVSFAVALSAGLCALALHKRRRIAVCVAALVALWLGGAGLQRVEWAQPQGAPLHATLVQANIALRDKWNPEKLPHIMERYRRMSVEAPASALVVWPEAALPTAWHRIDPAYLASLRALHAERGTDFLFGTIEYDLATRAVYNSVVVLGEHEDIYRKQHLVPFGEYVPFRGLFSWLMGSLEIPMSNFSRGSASQSPLRAAGRIVGISVCYEDAFGEEVVRTLPAATLLVNVSEDAWFGASLAPAQRLQMARMRAMENARPMLRAANTGPSAAIDHRGRILARSAQFRAESVPATVQPMTGATWYARRGNAPIVLLIVALLVVAWMGARREEMTRS